MKIGELIFELGFKADTMKLKDFGKAISELNMTSIISAGSFGALYEGAKALVGIADEMALGINKFGRETGQSKVEIQKWNHMAEEMGVSSGVVAGAVATLEDSLFKMRITGEGSNIWAMLGLDPTHTKDMFEVLTMLRNRLKGMSTDQQRFFLENLGLSTEMLNMFKMTDAQWASMAHQQVLSNEQLSEADKYHAQMVGYAEDLKKTWADFGISFMPIFDSLMKIADAIDQNILKSSEWAATIKTIADIPHAVMHPIQTFKNAAVNFGPLMRQLNDESFYGDTPEMRSKLALQGTRSDPNMKITVKNTVHTTDPNTKISTDLDKAFDDAVNDRPAGSV